MKIKIVLPAILMLAGLAFSLEDYAQWAHYRNIKLNTAASGGGANVTALQANFPLLVRLTAADTEMFAGSARSGSDLRFAKANGTTPLKYQIERWDSA